MIVVKAAEALRTARRRAGLSQRALAARAHTSQAAVHRYEAGTTQPTILALRRLVAACGFELDVALRPSLPTSAISAEQRAEIRWARQRPLEMRIDDLEAFDDFVREAQRGR